MTSRFASFASVLALPLLAACAAADPSAPSDPAESSDLATTTMLTAHVTGMTVWVEPVAVADWRYEQWVWVLHGRTSKNLESTFSYSSDDEFGETLVTSPRKFELVVDGMSMTHLLEGYPVHIQIETTTGAQKQYFVTIQMAPRFARFEGSSKIFVHTPIVPIVKGGTALFRARATTATGTSGLAVAGPIARPEKVVAAGHEFTFDWTWPNLLLAADPPADPIQFVTGAYSKHAGVDFAVDDFVLSTTAPDIGPVCDPGVLACLQALPNAAGDTSKCGDAGEVQPCMFSLGPIAASPTRFADDLALYLQSWYPDHAQDVASAGGAPMLEAQAGVHSGLAHEVTTPAGDPQGHDLSKYIVFAHPDTVFPGSDIVWFGAYDRATGALQSVYDFN